MFVSPLTSAAHGSLGTCRLIIVIPIIIPIIVPIIITTNITTVITIATITITITAAHGSLGTWSASGRGGGGTAGPLC